MSEQSTETPTPAPADSTPASEPSILDAAKAPDAPGSGEPTAKPEDGSSQPPTDATQPAKPTEPKPGAPEKYEAFKVPEGITLDPKAIESFNAVAKELNLSQDQAQKLVDYQTNAVKSAQETQLKNFEKLQKDWAEKTSSDLGANADKELAFAALARDKFAPENSELRTVLNESGLSNHPAVVKHFITIGKAISEDTLITGNPAVSKPKTDGQLFYPGMKLN